MGSKDLKLFAKCYVEAQKPSTKDTQVCFDFIDKSNDNQVINFMMTGKPEFVTKAVADRSVREFEEVGLSIVLVESTLFTSGQGIPESIVKLFFDLSQKITGKKPFTTIGSARTWLNQADAQEVIDVASYLIFASVAVSAVLLATIIGFILKKIANRTLSKAARTCRTLKGKAKTKCMYKFEVEILKNQMGALQKLMVACKKGKNPGVCRAKIKAKMTGLQFKIKKLQIKGKIN